MSELDVHESSLLREVPVEIGELKIPRDTCIALSASLLTITKLRGRLENAEHDETGLYRREVFGQYAERVRERASRDGNITIFALLDLDNLTEVNNTYGHAAGDKLIATCAQTMKSHIRPGDVCGRLGGDEFGISAELSLKRDCIINEHELLGMTTTELQIRMDEGIFRFYREELGVETPTQSVSIGLEFWRDWETFEEVKMRADASMYKQKAIRHHVIGDLAVQKAYGGVQQIVR